jgi:hypothetical protein
MLAAIQGQLTVEITLTLLGDAAAALLLILLEDLDLLKRLHDLAVDAAASINVLGGARAAVLGAAVDLAETANTDGLPEVDVAGDGSGADVVPVDVLGRHLLGGTGLDGIDPTCKARVRFGSFDRGSSNRRGTNRAQGACPGASRKPHRQLWVVSKAEQEEMKWVATLTDELVGLFVGSNMISKIPSSEIFRPPHACSFSSSRLLL